jgi:four helix bundle protein
MKVVRSTKMEFAESMKQRTKQFAINIIKLYRNMPASDDARILGRQLVKAATSVASNYRAVCRARSNREFFAKLSIVVEEAEKASFGWN